MVQLASNSTDILLKKGLKLEANAVGRQEVIVAFVAFSRVTLPCTNSFIFLVSCKEAGMWAQISQASRE